MPRGPLPVALATNDRRLGHLARQMAALYEALAPPPDEFVPEGFVEGQILFASLGTYGACTTDVR